MAVGTFAELQTKLANDLAKAYNSERVVEFIALAEPELNRRLRIRDMEAESDLALTSAATSVALPTRYLGMRRIYINTDPKRILEFLAPPAFWRRHGSSETSTPKMFTVEADLIEFAPAPDTDYTVKVLFWQAFAPLSDAAPTNDLLTNHPDVYVAASLCEAYLFKNDEKNYNLQLGRRERIIASIERSDQRDRYGPAPLQIRTDVNSP